jgi:hypothetical protein
MLREHTEVEPGGCLHRPALLIEVGKLAEALFGWRHNKHRKDPAVPFGTIGMHVDRTPHRHRPRAGVARVSSDAVPASLRRVRNSDCLTLLSGSGSVPVGRARR